MSRPRAIFFGSPAFAVPCLDATLEVADVVAVVSQPDRPRGRGLKLTPPPVKARAVELGLPVMQPTKVRARAFAEQLEALDADVGVVVAYGRILPRRVLDAPRVGCLNVHASLLPKWRGAAPIHWAIVNGDTVSGVTLMQMDEGMDTGPMLSTLEVPIGPGETAGELTERLSALGGDLLRRDLLRAVAGELTATPQDHGLATKASLLDKAHGAMDFGLSAQAVHDHARGMAPWPGAYTHVDGLRLKVHRTSVVQPAGQHGEPGVVLENRGALHVACGEGVLGVEVLQEDGRRRLPAEAFLAGRGLALGARLQTL